MSELNVSSQHWIDGRWHKLGLCLKDVWLSGPSHYHDLEGASTANLPVKGAGSLPRVLGVLDCNCKWARQRIFTVLGGISINESMGSHYWLMLQHWTKIRRNLLMVPLVLMIITYSGCVYTTWSVASHGGRTLVCGVHMNLATFDTNQSPPLAQKDS